MAAVELAKLTPDEAKQVNALKAQLVSP
jgi:hypothetical protein